MIKPIYEHNQLSSMRKPFAFTVSLLLVALLFVVVIAGTAAAKDLYTIPLNESIQLTPNLKANLIQLTISDTTYGSVYVDDQSKYVYPILVYTYQNVGTAPETGHLHVKFIDDQGQVYEDTDPGTFSAIAPGKTTASDFLEVAIPKDRKITQFVVIMGFNEQSFPISYGNAATPTPTQAPAGTASGTPGGFCLGSLVLPLTIVGLACAGFRLAKK
jgi:hypothetical protein